MVMLVLAADTKNDKNIIIKTRILQGAKQCE